MAENGNYLEPIVTSSRVVLSNRMKNGPKDFCILFDKQLEWLINYITLNSFILMISTLTEI